MPQPSAVHRILFVDDELSIRATLAPILEKSGFEVHTAGSVQEALLEINTAQFDALIADLNVNEPGDGLLVISAMRHIQPRCANFILTGYPGFETALEAIHHQVKDYLVKPVNAEVLVSTLRDKINAPKSTLGVYRVPELLSKHRNDILAYTIEAIRKNREISDGSPCDEELTDHLGAFLDAAIRGSGQEQAALTADILRRAIEYGKRHEEHHLPAAIVAAHFRLLELSIYRVLEENFPLTTLISDLKVSVTTLHLLFEEYLHSLDRLSSSNVGRENG